RVTELIHEFHTIQHSIAAVPTEPPDSEDYYTEGWTTLRQCAIDGQNILDCAADTTVPTPGGGEEEQRKAELKQVLLDAYSRRHEGQKTRMRQDAVQRWIEWRSIILAGGRPNRQNRNQLLACDQQLHRGHQELASITDELVYRDCQMSDMFVGRWTAEDPSLHAVKRWLRGRR
ncbi:hypothetical protein GMORB2_6980, partial [Geosmithia morbida]